jgi:hypothetical protein
MATRGTLPAPALRRPQLPHARLLLGAATAAVGLFVALHWIVLPGDDLSLNQKNRRTESIAARDSATDDATRRKAHAPRVAGARPGARQQTTAVKPRRQLAANTAPRTAGKPIGPAPGTNRPGAPAGGAPPASGSEGPAAIETPTANQSPPPPPPPPPSPPPVGLPQLPQLPEVPQVPVPSVPDLTKPEVPSVPIPQVPSLP